MRGRRPKPTAVKKANGNPGKRALNPHEPKPPASKPTCPSHLVPAAKTEWRRLASTLHEMGVLTVVDRAALAAYCQAYGRWVEAEEQLQKTPALLKTPSGYVQQSPWLSIANKQMELMNRYMGELGLTPAARSRIVAAPDAGHDDLQVQIVQFAIVDPQDYDAPTIDHEPRSTDRTS